MVPSVDGGLATVVDVKTAHALGDCSRADDECFEAHGVYEGRPFKCPGVPFVADTHKGRDEVTRFTLMLFSCSDLVYKVGMQLPVPAGPIDSPEPFEYAESPGQPRSTKAGLEAARGSGRDVLGGSSPSFTAHTRGVITPASTVRGSYTASWPSAECREGGAAGACAETSFTMTFNARVPPDEFDGEVDL